MGKAVWMVRCSDWWRGIKGLQLRPVDTAHSDSIISFLVLFPLLSTPVLEPYFDLETTTTANYLGHKILHSFALYMTYILILCLKKFKT